MTDTLTDISPRGTAEGLWADRRVKIGYETAESLALCYNRENWRAHPENQRAATEESIDTLGLIGQVKKSTINNLMFDGHLRVELALAKNPQMLLPVDYYDLTDDETALALTIHDAITEQAEPIPDKLAALLERTRLLTADRPGLGAMLAALKAKAGINGNGQGDNGDEPPMPTETEAERLAKQYETAPGQVWQLGRHIIACIDSTDEAAVRELIGGKPVGMVWADPPYGMGLDTDYSQMATWANKQVGGKYEGFRRKGGSSKSQTYDPVIGDSQPFDPAFIFERFGYVDELFLWGADYYAEKIPDRNKGAWLVWDKRSDRYRWKMRLEIRGNRRHTRRSYQHPVLSL